ncbi:cysteine-rich and transmembrane domain-containing protein 1-like [Gambusia affinis]|uniref:cysteine-rich and transmembrane domain-containing protein 1-like n=1 Tax=Gambusia affinis TaxID=33528 RepID=UPI001CDBB0CE|nr:cysteine-rich and transmembrane domain-containing protein 1-like [Gambusia affinis]
MSDYPPPYRPFFPDDSSPSMFPPGFYSPPTAFPGSAYQTFPQTIIQPGPAPQQGASVMSPAYYDNKHQASHPAKPTVLLMDPRTNQQPGGIGSYLAACSAALCCCCLWDLLHR